MATETNRGDAASWAAGEGPSIETGDDLVPAVSITVTVPGQAEPVAEWQRNLKGELLEQVTAAVDQAGEAVHAPQPCPWHARLMHDCRTCRIANSQAAVREIERDFPGAFGSSPQVAGLVLGDGPSIETGDSA